MTTKNDYLTMTKVMAARVRSLLDDGYVYVTQSYNTMFWFAKLKHRSNGNVIVIKAYPQRNHMIQTTNDKTTHYGSII